MQTNNRLTFNSIGVENNGERNAISCLTANKNSTHENRNNTGANKLHRCK